MGRGVDSERRIRSRICRRHHRRVKRIQEQAIIPEILVPPEHRLQVVPLILIDSETRDVVRVAAVTEVAEVQAVKQGSMMVEGPHT